MPRLLRLRPPLQSAAVELMDRPHPRPVMERTLRELARLNALLGVRRQVLSHLRRFVRDDDRTLVVADVGTGGADLPRLLVRWAGRRGIALRAVALDNHPTTAAIARDWSRPVAGIAVVVADARALPLGDRSVDVAVCTSALHHLEPPDAVRCLQELDRISRRGFIVTDLVRSWAAYAGARLLARTLLRGPLTRTDGPRSVLRSYTKGELRRLVEAAGVTGAVVLPGPLFRAAVVKVERT